MNLKIFFLRIQSPICFLAPNRAFLSKSSAKSAVYATAGKELLRRSCPLAYTGVLASGLSVTIAGAGEIEHMVWLEFHRAFVLLFVANILMNAISTSVNQRKIGCYIFVE
ncbi:MAG: hypothetical protein EA358_04660 [Flavobacteriales bacterium]|nr:MAG: hypothetical protein EA358_04660 [Flavobacteriales bacterium]